MAKLTYVSNRSDWEALYVDGEKVADQHLNRLWPGKVFDVIDEYNIEETEVLKFEPDEINGFPTNLSDIQ